MTVHKKKKRSHHGILIFFLTLLGISFEPGYPKDIPAIANAIIAIIMCIFLITLVFVVRKVTNKEKIFESRLTLNKFQLSVLLLLIGYSIFIYIENGNIPSLIDLFHQPSNIIISCTFVSLGAGFFEDYFVRGYLFNATQRILNRYNVTQYRMTIIAVITSCIFGLIHFTNLPIENAEAVFQQVFYAFCLGIVFCVFRIITNRIWPVATMHFIFDYSLSIIQDMTSSSWLETVSIFSVALIIGLVLLISIDRSIEKNNIQEINP